ncbi:MAG TPA: DinB family protein [Thermoanaerobaculia bacterium]|nr:DinB family protein [Thermoanaerobaculia bacterium]
MRPTERLLDQLNRAFGGEAWHGPALRNLLDGITERQAQAHPIEAGHSMLELVLHIATWNEVVAKRIGGIEAKSENVDDWTDVSKFSWKQAIERLEKAQSQLCDAVARLSSEELDEPAAGLKSSNFTQISGALQHMAYHAGQIALLKKA